MNLLSRVVWFVFWVVVMVWGIRLLRWLFPSALGDRGRTDSEPKDSNMDRQGRRLVRDPVCGTHVAEALAVPLREGSEVMHFCSTECRDKYAASLRKYAAHG